MSPCRDETISKCNNEMKPAAALVKIKALFGPPKLERFPQAAVMLWKPTIQHGSF
jgi:hypothetical protein